MLRYKRHVAPEASMRLVYSVRNAFDVIYRDELGDDAALTFTRVPPPGWEGHTGRIDAALVDPVLEQMATVFICGSNGFVEAASQLVLAAGVEPQRVLTERFGPTG
jgi:ferredoxin-NADP reductase